MLISVFDNSRKALVYGQVEIIHDINDLRKPKDGTLVRLKCAKGIRKRCVSRYSYILVYSVVKNMIITTLQQDVEEVKNMKPSEKRCCGYKKPRRRKDKGGQALFDDHGYNTIPEIVFSKIFC